MTTDQRGVARPQGAADDIGAFEVVAACPAFPASVATEGELNIAIGCYNALTTPGTYTINITQDVALTASTTQINNATAGIDLVIEGAGFTVDGQGTAGVRPFDIAASTTVTMNEITVSGGNVTGPFVSGGGIRNVGNLTLNNSTLSGNMAEGLGGGLWNGGIVTITNSTVTGNTSTDNYGGGLDNSGTGTMTLQNSTVSGNTATEHGGGISSFGTTNIDSTTIAGNTSTSYGGALFLESGITTLRNSILADSTGGVDCGVLFGSISDGGHNLVESLINCPITNGVNGNIVGEDPMLGPLADNGGPTQTRALLAGSPAIDAGDTTLTTDQRGVARPQGTADDIGAFEVSAPLRFTIEAPTVQTSQIACPAPGTSLV
ncbi:MAG: hypothetical protein KDD75_01040, partial [Caldilineaceae bacterium]|nr:hypothetical protein [Caldilineaceae bacterium]